MPRISSYKCYHLQAPYRAPTRWGGHEENAVQLVLLEVRTSEDRVAIAEMPVRPAWHRIQVGELITQLDQVLSDVISEGRELESFALLRNLNPLTLNLIDIAAWQLHAVNLAQPLWKALGGAQARVPVSWTVTRDRPANMARNAANAADLYGISAFKIKTGQGFDVDREVVKEMRRAVGDDARFFVDSNGAGESAQVETMAEMLAAYGVMVFEDPCRLTPGTEFTALQERCRIPILVDDACRSYNDAERLCSFGAQALSVKTMKTGFSQSLTISSLAQQKNVKVSVGLTAASAFGALATLSLAAALPEAGMCGPCEESFFASFDDYLLEPIRIREGCVTLPSDANYANLIDWGKVKRLTVS